MSLQNYFEETFGIDICKGVYVDNAQNRRLGRVGKSYGKQQNSSVKNSSGNNKNADKLNRDEKGEISKIFNKFMNRIYWGVRDSDFEDERGKKFISDLKKYGSERVAKYMVWKSKHSMSEGRDTKYQAVGRRLVGEKRFKELYYAD